MKYGRRIHPDQPWMWYDDASVMLEENDTLVLSLAENPTDITYWDGKVFHSEIATGTIRSATDFGFGKFSAEILLPKGYGLWPSFWLTGSNNWPPEIDIVEAWNDKNGYFKWFRPQPPYFYPSWRATTNVHYNEDWLEKFSVGSRNIGWCRMKDPSENWITYECEWTQNKITFSVVSKKRKRVRVVEGDECHKMTRNLANPDGGFQMDVVFNIWCQNPKLQKVRMITPMKIRNFKFDSYGTRS